MILSSSFDMDLIGSASNVVFCLICTQQVNIILGTTNAGSRQLFVCGLQISKFGHVSNFNTLSLGHIQLSLIQRCPHLRGLE